MQNLAEKVVENIVILLYNLYNLRKNQTIVERMKNEKKILIKAYENVGEFGDCLRVSIGEKKYMQQFMVALLELDK